MTSDVTVRLDDRIRLVSAVLALTTYPEKIQAEHPHGSHPHARTYRRQFKEHMSHPAVTGMQSLLDNGAPLEAMFTLVAHLPFPTFAVGGLPKWVPTDWNKHLADFYEVTNLKTWWQAESSPWDEAMSQCQAAFKDVDFKTFLTKFMGTVTEDFVFQPNISYPSHLDLGMRVGKNELIAVCPPRLAWGDSNPWPYEEDIHYLHGASLAQYIRLILVPYLRENAESVGEAAQNELPVSDKFRAEFPTWGDQFVNIFLMGTVAIYLEEQDEREGAAYLQQKVKRDGVTILPGAVSVLKRYLQEKDSGKFNELADFMPVFPKQLKVAKRIMSL